MSFLEAEIDVWRWEHALWKKALDTTEKLYSLTSANQGRHDPWGTYRALGARTTAHWVRIVNSNYFKNATMIQ